MPGARYTYEERKLIEKHIKAGLTARETSRMLGKSLSGIQKEVKKCGSLFLYNADEAQKVSFERRNRMFLNLNNVNRNLEFLEPDGKVTYEERFEMLEEQVKLLHQIIRDMRSKGFDSVKKA